LGFGAATGPRTAIEPGVALGFGAATGLHSAIEPAAAADCDRAGASLRSRRRLARLFVRRS
ncbi:MAG TPA: hypothetical protein VFH70_04735, partial [Acidimicrobiales bacterium]|nr:hypothetical protein [Acidimicrobiales bacterium]